MDTSQQIGYLDPKSGGDQSDLGGSTRAPSTNLPDTDREDKQEDMEEMKEEKEKADFDVAEPEEAAVDYPTGPRFFFIVVALVMSIFLLSLDMVCSNSSLHP